MLDLLRLVWAIISFSYSTITSWWKKSCLFAFRFRKIRAAFNKLNLKKCKISKILKHNLLRNTHSKILFRSSFILESRLAYNQIISFRWFILLSTILINAVDHAISGFFFFFNVWIIFIITFLDSFVSFFCHLPFLFLIVFFTGSLIIGLTF